LEFTTWRKTLNSFLWLNGKPGCGKSILSSIIIDNLKGALLDAEVLFYFYFDFSEAEK
jgi:adenylylsulfate kinase-like enzyme